jgi:hypothetical protein
VTPSPLRREELRNTCERQRTKRNRSRETQTAGRTASAWRAGATARPVRCRHHARPQSRPERPTPHQPLGRERHRVHTRTAPVAFASRPPRQDHRTGGTRQRVTRRCGPRRGPLRGARGAAPCDARYGRTAVRRKSWRPRGMTRQRRVDRGVAGGAVSFAPVVATRSRAATLVRSRSSPPSVSLSLCRRTGAGAEERRADANAPEPTPPSDASVRRAAGECGGRAAVRSSPLPARRQRLGQCPRSRDLRTVQQTTATLAATHH